MAKFKTKLFVLFHTITDLEKKPPKSWPKFADFTTAYVVEIEGL
jgi:hypothetical protein